MTTLCVAERLSGGVPLLRVPLFPLGRVVATPRALHLLIESGDSVVVLLARHALGDWGDLDPADRAQNDRAIGSRDRLLSEYRLANGERLWIVTEADRSATTLVLPQEYQTPRVLPPRPSSWPVCRVTKCTPTALIFCGKLVDVRHVCDTPACYRMGQRGVKL